MSKKNLRIQSLDELFGLEEEEKNDIQEDIKKSTKKDIEYLAPGSIRPFRNHPFHLYEGERLKDLVDSIAENGVLVPVIVRAIEPDENGYRYEMLAGHNRQQGAIKAGVDKIPCIVKDNLTDREAWIYVIETNVIQRSFAELLPSEKAAVLALRYSKVISQGKRNDIIAEIKQIEKGEEQEKEQTCGTEFHFSRSRDSLGMEYNLTGRMVAKYLRIHELTAALKQRIDRREIILTCGVTLSYLSKKEQGMLEKILQTYKYKITPQNAAALRKKSGELNTEIMLRILAGEEKKNPETKPAVLRVQPDIYKKYFLSEVSQKEFDRILDQALALYFADRQAGH